MFVTGLVLAAGSSRRLGRPKQLLPFRGATLLGAGVSVARDCGFDQLLVTVGGFADDVVRHVDLHGCQVVHSPEFTEGCSASLTAAVPQIDADSDGVVLMLGDQPGIDASTVAALIGKASPDALGVCRYADGLGHPLWLGRIAFEELAQLHGDKAVWKLLESGRFDTFEVPVDGPVPLDVDTWEDFEALLERDGEGVR